MMCATEMFQDDEPTSYKCVHTCIHVCSRVFYQATCRLPIQHACIHVV